MDVDDVRVISNMIKKFDHINESIVANHNQVTESLNSVKNYVCSEVKQIYAKIKSVESIVTMLENRIDMLERDKVSNDIIISGVPINPDMNLNKIILDICKAVGIQDGSTIVHNAFLPNYVNRKSYTLPIIVKFVNWQAKLQFFRGYIKLGNLNLTHIGLRSTTRIYCNDGLTKVNSNIYNNAKALVKQKRLAKVISKKGQIFVMLPNQSNYVLIKSIDQLKELSAESESLIVQQDQISNVNTINNIALSRHTPTLMTTNIPAISPVSNINSETNERINTTTNAHSIQANTSSTPFDCSNKLSTNKNDNTTGSSAANNDCNSKSSESNNDNTTSSSTENTIEDVMVTEIRRLRPKSNRILSQPK